MTGQKKEEYWDVYTEDRIRTGRLHRRGDRMKEGDYHLVVHVCIFNSKNQLLIQQRQPFKKGWPNMWDLSVGGSAVAGDSSSRAAEREVMEELGLELDLSHCRPVFTMNFSDGFDDYYIVKKDVDLSVLRLQEEEVQRVRWVGKEEAMEMQRSGIFIPYWFLGKLFEITDTQSFDAHGDRRRMLRVDFASAENLHSWMSLAEIVRDGFPGLETTAALEDYRNTVVKNMERGSAVCALDNCTVVGILLFSEKRNQISCMAVHPEYRRQHIASRMVQLMLTKLDRSRDIAVETFREGDERGAAARSFYTSMGFLPGEFCMSLDYPTEICIEKTEIFCPFPGVWQGRCRAIIRRY